MQSHRTVPSCAPIVRLALFSQHGNSTLYELEAIFGYDNPAILRCFSLAITLGAVSYCKEQIPPCGIIAEDNGEVQDLGCWTDPTVYRYSFWKAEPGVGGVDNLDEALFVGYAIFKRDGKDAPSARWYVFEAVFRPSRLSQKCISFLGRYEVCIGCRHIFIEGVLYCQQNSINKTCSQVALRSLLSRIVEEADISYSLINKLAFGKKGLINRTDIGLAPCHIEAVLDAIGLGYYGATFSVIRNSKPVIADDIPYLRVLYSGVEAGYGSLLGFGPHGIDSSEKDRHVVPMFGHTFDCDTWVAGASNKYFTQASRDEDLFQSVQSDSWLGCFIAHDDNLGPDLLVPRHYVRRELTFYAGAILAPASCTPSVVAEERGRILLEIISKKYFMDLKNEWAHRIAEYDTIAPPQVVLRTIRMPGTEYIKHLCTIKDVRGHVECNSFLEQVVNIVPKEAWVIEISLSPMFAFEDKVGEMVLDAAIGLLPGHNSPSVGKHGSAYNIWDCFRCLRMPEVYFLHGQSGQPKGFPKLSIIGSSICSHVPCIKQNILNG